MIAATAGTQNGNASGSSTSSQRIATDRSATRAFGIAPVKRMTGA